MLHYSSILSRNFLCCPTLTRGGQPPTSKSYPITSTCCPMLCILPFPILPYPTLPYPTLPDPTLPHSAPLYPFLSVGATRYIAVNNPFRYSRFTWPHDPCYRVFIQASSSISSRNDRAEDLILNAELPTLALPPPPLSPLASPIPPISATHLVHYIGSINNNRV